MSTLANRISGAGVRVVQSRRRILPVEGLASARSVTFSELDGIPGSERVHRPRAALTPPAGQRPSPGFAVSSRMAGMFVAHQGRRQQSHSSLRPLGHAVLSAPPARLLWTVRAAVGCCLAVATALAAQQAAMAEDVPAALHGFLDKHCFSCHDTETKKGDLDLQTAAFAPDQAKNMTLWVTVHDRVRDGEMPPKKKPRPEAGELQAFLDTLERPLIAADLAREARDGRST